METLAVVNACARRERIVQAGSLQAVLDQPGGRGVLEAEANDPDVSRRLITPEQLAHLLAVHEELHRPSVRLGLFLSTDDVIIVPGFLGSSLSDTKGDDGLIWVDPKLLVEGHELSDLRLGTFRKNEPDADASDRVRVEATGVVPVVYDLMRADLEVRRYSVQVFPYDWRGDIGRAAARLADVLRGRLGRKPRPLHIIAHSVGSLVARRAIQILGAAQARRLVNNLVLLGPCTRGAISAAFALAGNPDTLSTIQRFGVKVPGDFADVLRSFTGLYQILPWDPSIYAGGLDPMNRGKDSPWKTILKNQNDRLNYGFKWPGTIDTQFFNDRTTIILGDAPTIGAVRFENGVLAADHITSEGDGTVTDALAVLKDVRTYRAKGAEHSVLPMQLSVLSAVRAILRGDSPAIERTLPAASTVRAAASADGNGKLQKAGKTRKDDDAEEPPPVLVDPGPPASMPDSSTKGTARRFKIESNRRESSDQTPLRIEPPTPSCRKLRVFSFDPLVASQLDNLEIAELTLKVRWEAEGELNEGPVGEYVEVVDYDPASRCFYAPVDLTLPRLTAQDGLPPSESSPQFHQQMCYAVAMATIGTFEEALGRVALWGPRLERNPDGKVIPGQTADTTYVPRLRIYPHALREANAYYDPEKHALLFGYFPSREQRGGSTLPGGTVFTCQSFDIVAHETTHALLHGLHRNYLYPSNPDLLAFHEAFADVVALFQHFSHTEVLRSQIARTRGDLTQENLLGQLAMQFGRAMGEHRGALRRYIDQKPDPDKYLTTDEPHDRGAILVAALFGAFQKIYEKRSRDLYRIATGGTGKLPDGDIHPDLVDRLAVEAAKSARHVLTMCVRALDYVPPVDLTFGEYLRALITADYDLVRNDDRHYRVAMVDAFRSWGIYPPGVNVLDETALLWRPPAAYELEILRGVIHKLQFSDWTLRADRRTVYREMERGRFKLRKWLYRHAEQSLILSQEASGRRKAADKGDGARHEADSPAALDHDGQFGLRILGKGWQSVPRNQGNRPKFSVDSIRPCSRVGPDGQQRIDFVAVITQTRAGYFDPEVQKEVDEAKLPWRFFDDGSHHEKNTMPDKPKKPDFWFRGGCSLIIDPERAEVRYCISKCVLDDDRLRLQREFEQTGALPAAATYFGRPNGNPFAMLHSLEE